MERIANLDHQGHSFHGNSVANVKRVHDKQEKNGLKGIAK